MAEDLNYIYKIIKRVLNIALIVFGVYIGVKMAVFYMPFLVAFIISLMVEPAIKYLMKKTRLSRKMSSIIIFIIVFTIIIGSVAWGIISLISESTNLLQTLNLAQEASQEILLKVSEWVTSFLTKLLSLITSLPTITIYVIITILSVYFVCTDRIYILDFMEHHMPKKWVQKIGIHVKEITRKLGGYLKAEAILILVSFVISLVGLYILKFVGMNVKYPLLIALGIGFVDALPILGSGSVMAPWAVVEALNGDIQLGISILSLWLIMSIVRQFLEPKIVSGKIGIHPIFTLIAMYTGFKVIGVMGMLVGPIVLIILKSVFANVLEDGISNRFF